MTDPNLHPSPNNAPRRSLRRRSLRLLLLVITPILTLVALEFVARALVETGADAGLFSKKAPTSDWLIPRPSKDNATRVDNSRNQLNLRERWETVPGDESTSRIAFVGDSFTYAACVEQEDGFVHKIERLLNNQLPRANSDQPAFVTINVGQPGTDPLVQAHMYADIKNAITPDIVIHVLYCNDLGHDLVDELVRIHTLQQQRSRLARNSILWDALESRIRGEIVHRRTLDYFRGGDSPLQRQQAWSRLEHGVREIRALAESDDAKHAIILFPWFYALDDYPLDDVHARMARLAESLNAPFLDLLTVFENRDAAPLRVSVLDEHPSPMAHSIAADAIVAFLIGKALVPTSESE
jgi:hypothetical protein